jgi:hypothetical protein
VADAVGDADGGDELDDDPQPTTTNADASSTSAITSSATSFAERL